MAVHDLETELRLKRAREGSISEAFLAGFGDRSAQSRRAERAAEPETTRPDLSAALASALLRLEVLEARLAIQDEAQLASDDAKEEEE